MAVYFALEALICKQWVSNVRLHVDDQGMITKIEPETSIVSGDERLSGPVIPALGNCHSHAFQRLFSGLTEGFQSDSDSFWSWRERMYQLLQVLNPEHVGIICRQLYIEMLKAGYSRVGEFHYLHNQPDGTEYADQAEMSMQIMSAANDTGIGLTLLPVLYQYSGFGKQTATESQRRFVYSDDRYLRLIENIRNACEGSNVICGAAPHSLRAVDAEAFSKLYSELPDNILTHIHIAEQLPEVEQCLSHSGFRPVEYLYEHLAVDDRWTLIHATHITETEVAMIKSSAAVIGICPTTEANLGDGLLPDSVFNRQTPCRWAIGSDSHISVDAIEELRWLEYGQRLSSHRRAVITSEQCRATGIELWSNAVEGAAQSIAASAGLKVGEQADWIVLNPEHPSIASLPAAYRMDALIFSNRANGVIRDVYVSGRRLIKDGLHPLEDKASLAYSRLVRELITS